jgi:hypothetical protein
MKACACAREAEAMAERTHQHAEGLGTSAAKLKKAIAGCHYPVRTEPKIGQNEPARGSGKKRHLPPGRLTKLPRGVEPTGYSQPCRLTPRTV